MIMAFLVPIYFGMALLSVYLTELFGKIIVTLGSLYPLFGLVFAHMPALIVLTLLLFAFLVYEIPASAIKNEFPIAGRNTLRVIMVATMVFAIMITNWWAVIVIMAFTSGECPPYTIPETVHQIHLAYLATRSIFALGGLGILMFVCDYGLRKKFSVQIVESQTSNSTR